MNDMRKVEILENNEWKEVAFPNLKDGDIFRLFDGNEPVVSNIDGTTQWKVTGSPYLNEENIWAVSCELLEEDAKKILKRMPEASLRWK